MEMEHWNTIYGSTVQQLVTYKVLTRLLPFGRFDVAGRSGASFDMPPSMILECPWADNIT